MANGFPKAVSALWTATTVAVHVDCVNAHNAAGQPLPFSAHPAGCVASECVYEEQDGTKLDGYRAALAAGWTYDERGRWRCPSCTAKKDS